jgi:hypothetical protein
MTLRLNTVIGLHRRTDRTQTANTSYLKHQTSTSVFEMIILVQHTGRYHRKYWREQSFQTAIMVPFLFLPFSTSEA